MTVRDLKLDADGDIVLENGDLALVSDAEAIAQAVRGALSLVQGEWFLDVTAGVPYFESVWLRAPKESEVDAVLRSAILAVPGVLDVPQLDLDLNRSTRVCSVSFRATTDLGELSQTIEVTV